jgi:hypothetical protein
VIHSEVRALVQDLLARTRDGDVNWYPSSDLGLLPSQFDDYAVSLPDYAVNVFRRDDTLNFNIYDSQAELIYHADAEPGTRDWELLDNLLNDAKFKARRVQDALARIREAIAAPGVVGSRLPPPPAEEEIPF